MGIIVEQIRLEGSKGEKIVSALFDTGSTFSLIRKDIAIDLGIVDKIRKPLKPETVEKGKRLKITEAVRLDFYLDGYRFSDEFLVVNNLSEEVIIGMKTLQSWHIKLDLENQKLIIDPRATRIKLM